MKNIHGSIQAKLRNISKEKNMNFVLISRLYMQEGFLRRISLSNYSSSFLLKGGLLLYSITGFTSRPTQDIDFLGKNLPKEQNLLKEIIIEIVSIEADDGLVFILDSIAISSITEGAEYQGQRIKITCKLGNIRTNMKLDIGFGDVIYPEQLQLDYPTLLENPSFLIQSYSLESIIAEKFQAMIVLDARNSRMKDFFDIYDIFIRYEIEDAVLHQAIQQTFSTRKTILPENPAIFTLSFSMDPRNVKMWENFLTRIKAEQIDFREVIEQLKKRLEPIYQKLI